jgi:hypothetical protein
MGRENLLLKERSKAPPLRAGITAEIPFLL